MVESEITCPVNSTLCEGEDIFLASYTTHTTTVTVYPKHISPSQSSVVIDNKLEWNTTPANRMSDLMLISWDGDDFSEKFSTIQSSIEAQYTLIDRSGFLCLKTTSSSGSEPIASFNPNSHPSIYKIMDDGVIFQPSLVPYRDNNDYNPTSPCRDEKIFTKITINMHVELIIDHFPSIFSSTLTNTSIKAEYIHFWKQLAVNLSLNAGITVTGPTAGIALSPSITTKHDDPRTNYLQFLFTR